MYEQYFNLKSWPFSATPDVEKFVPAHAIQKSLSTARMCIDRTAGPVIVIGEPGTGKSLLMALLNEQYRAQYKIANLVCSRMDGRQELLQNILFELQLPYRGLSEGELRLSLTEHLRSDASGRNGVLFLIDEAHNLSVSLLEEIRLISNVTRNGLPAAKCVLSGTIRLEESLNDPRLQSFNQQVAARCYLTNLLQSETAEYVTIHVDRAGGDGKQLFSSSSVEKIHELTDGSPRLINQLCDHALILTMADGQKSIQEKNILDAWSELQNLPGTFCLPHASSASSCDGSRTCQGATPSDWTLIEFGSLDDDDQEKINKLDSCSSSTDWNTENVAHDRDVDFTPKSSQTWRPTIEITGEYFEPYSQPDTAVPVPTPQDPAPAPKPVAANPFSEEFDQVDVIQDRFEKRVAECNRAAIRTSSDDLGCLNKPGQADSAEPEQNLDGADHSAAWNAPVHTEWQPAEIPDPVSQYLPQPSATFDPWPSSDQESGEYTATPIVPLMRAGLDSANHSATFKFQPTFDQSSTKFAAASLSSLQESLQESLQNDSAEIPEADEFQSLKAKIEQQNRFSTQAFDRIVVETNSQARNSGWKIAQAAPAVKPTATKLVELTSSRDDRDILICEQTYSADEPQFISHDSDELLFAQTPVSTGRAERIDYKQLFDQLRDLPENS